MLTDDDWQSAGFDPEQADKIIEDAVHFAQQSYKDVQKLLLN